MRKNIFIASGVRPFKFWSHVVGLIFNQGTYSQTSDTNYRKYL
jgi:hypothetical protein